MHALSQILKKIRDCEKLILDEYQLKHGPTIGKMYEGLTKKILDESKLDKYGIKIVSGFMQSGSHKSKQIDCMVVTGNGEKIPHIEEYIYPTNQVIAVIEVKKNLFSPEISDAYDLLNDVFRLSKIDCEIRERENSLNFSTQRPADEYMSLFGERAPSYEKNKSLPFQKRTIYHNLVRDSLIPLRIAIGYNGYRSEQSLRDNFDKIYDGRNNQTGYGVINMPNLMISDVFSVVKTNGLPYRGFWDEECGWGILSTSSENPLLLLLEVIYDRIELALGVTIDRGPDLNEETLHPLLCAKPESTEQSSGWIYRIIKNRLPEGEQEFRKWAPLEISNSQHEVLALVHSHGRLSSVDAVLANVMARYAIEDIYEHVRPLIEARYLLNTDGVLSIGSAIAAVAKINDRFYCSDNSGGRFDQWITDVPM